MIRKFQCVIVLIGLILIGLFMPLVGQNAYYEALPLSKIGQEDIAKYKALLQTGILTADEKTQLTGVIAFLEDPWTYVAANDSLPIGILSIVNQKLSASIASHIQQGKTEATTALLKLQPTVVIPAQTPALTPTQTAIPSSFMNKTFQTELIDAVGTIIAERFKEDITTIYITKLKTELGQTDICKHLQILFPGTAAMVMNTDPFTYFSLATRWKAAFNSDLRKLPDDLLDYIQAFYPGVPKENPVYPYLELVFKVSGKLIAGYHPVDIFNYLDITYKYNAEPQPPQQNRYASIYHAIRFVNLFQKNLQQLNAAGAFSSWVNFGQVAELIESEAGISYFLALVYLQDKTFFNTTRITVSGQVFPLVQLLKESGSFFEKYVYPSYKVLMQIKVLDEKVKSGTGDIADYLQAGLDIFEKTDVIFNPDAQNNQEIFQLAQNGLDLYRAISIKDYYNTIARAFTILEGLTRNKSPLNNTISKFAAFIEGIAGARDAGQMRSVISAVILPPGGFMAKRTSRFNLSISAHPGLYAGLERAINNAANTSDWGTNFGFTAPLGVELCWGSQKQKSFISSLGLFVSVADLGAVVSYRLPQSDPYAGLPNSITLKQVFSPGVSMNLGLKNTPIAFGLGFQYTPELRKITDPSSGSGKGNVLKANSWRWFLRVSWDLPLLNIKSTRF